MPDVNVNDPSYNDDNAPVVEPDDNDDSTQDDGDDA